MRIPLLPVRVGCLSAVVLGTVPIVSPSRAALPVYEGFDYPAGAGIAGQDGGVGWTAAWAAGSANGLATNVAGSLAYTDAHGRALPTAGGSLVVGNPAGAALLTATPNRTLPVNLSGGTGTTAGPGETTWISFLYRRRDLAPAPYLRQANLGLFEGGGERVAVGGPNTSETVANVLSVWGSGGAHGAAAPFQALDYPITAGATYWILLKVVADASPAPDTAYVWFNWPDLLAEPDPGTAVIVQDEINLSSVDTLRFQAGNLNANGSNAVFQADELRVGATFADVAPSVAGSGAPSINAHPADRTVTAGETAVFMVSAGGEPPLHFQWVYAPHAALPGQTNALLEIPAAQVADAGGYFVIVSNPVGAVTSAVATLTVLPPQPPAIATQPQSQVVLVGAPVVFTVEAAGQAPLAYQWRRDGVALPARQTNAALSIAAAQLADAGGYSVVVANALGAVTSAVATLTVIDPGPPGLPAFPGADGAARTATGGRGGVVYHVTKLDRNLNHGEPGTLRYGLTDANFPAGMPRTIVFNVAGVFWLGRLGAESGHDNGWDASSRYNLPDNVTLAGQSAPGPVVIMGGVVKAGGSNVILRNLTFAPGYGMRGFREPPADPVPGTFPDAYVYDAVDVSGQHILIDHCTAVYATDEAISCNEDASDLTIQYCNISQGQNYPQADAEASGVRYTGHALGSLLQAGSGACVSVLHNLYAHQKGRLPRVGTEAGKLTLLGVGANNDFRNNLFYNWFNTAGTGASGQPSQNNFLHNFYLAGPGGEDPIGGTNSNLVLRAGGVNLFNGDDPALTRVYRSGNLKDTNKDGDPHDAVSANADFVSIAAQPAAYEIGIGVTLPAAAALTNVLRHAGARWWVRGYDFTVGNADAIGAGDVAAAVDERLIHEAATGAGGIRAWADDPFDDDPAEGTEWRALLALRADPATSAAPFNHPPGWDGDGDGMPDAWELAHGLDPELPTPNGDFDADGYTDLEEYLNEVAAWPGPGTIVFTGEAGPRYAEIFNWRVTGVPVNISGLGTEPTASLWQPSRYDNVLISHRTAVVDAPGQHAGALELADAAVLDIRHGWLAVETDLGIGNDCTLAVQSGGRLATGHLANYGTLRLTGSATLQVTGTFTNHAVIDIITWAGELPPGLVNHGTLLEPGSIRIGDSAVNDAGVAVTLHGYPGHAYQLQYADSAATADWLDTGPAVPGADAPLVLTHPAGTAPPQRYHRVAVH